MTDLFPNVIPKGRHQYKKNVFFQPLPESPKPPSLTPIRATWSFFFGRQRRRFALVIHRMTGKSFDDNGCIKYDDNDGNFDYNYVKNNDNML